MNIIDTYKDIGAILNPSKKVYLKALIWEDIIYVSTRHLITPALLSSLRKKGIEDELSQDLKDYFTYIHSLSIERNKKIMKQTIEVVRILNDIGIKPFLLKGVANLFSGLYETIGDRIVGDIDLLVPKERGKEAFSVLVKNGYYCASGGRSAYKMHHHLPPLFHKDKLARIELHTYPLEKRYKDILSLSHMWNRAIEVRERGIVFYIPDLSSNMIINIMHEELSNRNYYFFRLSLKGLYDFFLYFRKGRGELSELRCIFKKSGYYRVFEIYLHMMREFFDTGNSPYGKDKFFADLYWYIFKIGTFHPIWRKIFIIILFFCESIIDKSLRNVIFLYIDKFFVPAKRKEAFLKIRNLFS